ncbi:MULTISPECIES: DNA polymerase III subunit delta [Gardnerella]|uniref:DNA polymerase III subunit delta n=1 Tax=Gardnerella vaginalis TaxID=2702 RepID=A0AAP8LSD1_GARVA|nr:DNA polymerase III subunit delta [Gardnerella sp. 30-4]EFH27400.1 DNA polymerase III, delta subunit [Gardnerella vaginalis AMD]EIK77530.1 DNA polymerase III, delta subunit [Gardnerella vaginalis 6420LIT]EIK79488.1 DNA polymerase III, delta subunit [Gardnerella vaginalis 6420B]NSX52890.1 DNA polymerase III subunit delta [Gardnerella vaginalis]RIY27867.1 DNA polymerase III subunit delta [Bifidobacteriaceae bacterium WP022]RIY30552.1 DNA polymerase III subunit delta [Bifidobacteriaceae bacter
MAANNKRAQRVMPVTLVVGGDAYLNELNARNVREKVQKSAPDAEIIELDASTADQYAFDEAVGPSLFGDGTIVIINNLQQADESLVDAIENFCKQTQNSENSENNFVDSSATWVIARHEGGLKGKSIITRLTKAGANTITVPDLKKDDAKLNFVMSIFERHNRSVEPQAAQRLVSVLGSKTGELAALCSQLCFDYDDNPITLDIVDRYLIADPQVTGFFVADKAVAGHAGSAVLAARTAIAQGVDAIALIGALAAKVRVIALAMAIRNGTISSAEAKVNPWALKMAMRQLAGWNSAGVSKCLQSLAWADEQCKGGSSDANYALEKCIMLIASRGN